jgi:hypothetical protein
MPTIQHTNMKLLAVLVAAGIHVHLYRKPGQPRTVVGQFLDVPSTRALIEAYERRLVVDVPQKSVMQAFIDLGIERKRLVMEAL